MKARYSDLAGRALRELPYDLPSSAEYAAQRAALVRGTRRRAPRDGAAGWPRRLVWVASLCVAAGLTFALWSRPTLLEFRVGESGEPGELGSYYAAQPGAVLPLRFADGTTVALNPGARARVAEAAGARRVVLLETGAAEFRVVHQPGVSWNVHAGPYRVHVTGTEFRLAWDGAAQRLALDMRSGSVAVSGPGITGVQRVEGRQRFRANPGFAELLAGSETAAVTPEAPASRAAEPEPPAASANPSPSAPPRVASGRPAASSRPSESSGPKEDWTALLGRGRYREILDSAAERGIDSVLASGSASDLRSLADAARFSGQGQLARRVLTSLRDRFSGSEAGRAALFLLGRMADDAGDLQGALTSYDQYLAQRGELAAEALGRRMLVVSRLGRRSEAREAAREYLRRYPEGPYSGRAESLSR